MKNIFSVKTLGHWWRGEVSVRYNLFTVARMLLGLIVVPFLLLFYAGKGLYLGAVWLFNRLKPLGSAIALLATALWFGFCRMCNRKAKTKSASETAETPMPERETPEQGRSDRWMWWLLLLSLLIALIGTWRSCSSAEDEDKGEPTVVYDRAFDEVIVARAYLDGVQEKISDSCPRALVGFKFINDRPVKDFDFEGMTYDQAVDVVARDWKPLVVGYLNPEVVLSKQQMVVVTLAAMRMGKAGFVRSTFLQKVNEGDLTGAGKWLLLQKADGSVYPTGDEPKQYFYILQLLWHGDLAIGELLDFPMFSYKGIDVGSVYTIDGEYVYTPEIGDRLTRGSYPTPREALELW